MYYYPRQASNMGYTSLDQRDCVRLVQTLGTSMVVVTHASTDIGKVHFILKNCDVHKF